jgi:hypothetical protein
MAVKARSVKNFAAVLALLGLAAGCSTAVTSSVSPASETAPGKGGSSAAHGHGAGLAPSAPPGPVSVAISTFRAADGSVITLAEFHGPVQYVLHDGSLDPKVPGRLKEGPKVTGPERARLLAAFNGGFQKKSHAGGYEQEGHVAWPLQWGLASLVINAQGHARIGVWGQTVPARGERLYDVRQNLWLLVNGGQPTAQSGHWWRWGGTIGNREYVARSALGQDAGGNLIYAASMSTTPADLAQALAKAGARVAMELDINPEWVQMDAATTPGGPLKAEIPRQNRPANQYLTGWTRDFIAVLAPS